MTKQLRYPAEAFALAIVLFNGGLKEAALVGIGIIFAAVLQSVLRENCEKNYGASVSALGAMLGAGAIYLMLQFCEISLTGAQQFALAAMVILLLRSDERACKCETIDYNELLLQSACAYACYLVIALVKEYLGSAEIFGYELPKTDFVSHAFEKPMLALFFAAIAIAAANRILKVAAEYQSGTWPCIFILLIEPPFVWNNVPELLGTAVGVLFGLVVYLTLRRKLLFADTEKNIIGIPVNLALLGVIYMVFSFL